MFFSRIFLLFTAATAVSAMTTHFGKRDVHHRRAVAARQPEPVAATPVAVVPRIRKRANGRCKASNATSSAVQATSSAPENVGNSPPTFTSSPVEHTTATPTQEPTEAPAPTTSKTPTPTTHKTTPTPTPSPTNGGGSSGGSTGATHSGDGTFYGTGLGSCGITNKDTDYIAAVSHILYDSFPDGGNPNNNPVCNRKATATYQGKSVTVTITDRCVGCAEFDLDFSPSAFSQLADQSIGRIHGMTWHFDD